MAHSQPSPAPPGWIIDTDCGVDDAQALFLMLAHHERGCIRIAAITCVHGNCTLAQVLANVAATLQAFALPGQPIPVFVGCDRALCAASTKDGSKWHGEDGLGNTGLGAAVQPAPCAPAEHASAALLRLAREGAAAGAPLSLLTLGPLTNVALALRLGSAGGAPLPGCLARLVVMGGAYQARGNVTPAAEFNFLEDPEAAAAALATDWAPATLDLVTWELTQSCGLAPAALAAWLQPQPPTPRAAFLARISQHLLTQSQAFSPAQYAQRGFLIPDPLAACVALDAGVVAESVQCGVLVETGGRWGRGATLVDWHGSHREEAPACVRIIQAVHRGAVEALLAASTR